MTEKQLISFIKEKERFPRDFEFYSSLWILLAPIGFIVIGGSMLLNVINFGNDHLIYTGLPIFIIGILLVIIIYNNQMRTNKFFLVETKLDKEKNFTIAVDIMQNDLEIENIDKNISNELIYGERKTSLLSWGQYITAVCLEKKILINSRPRFGFNIYHDNRNINIFKSRIKERINSPVANNGYSKQG